MRCWPGGRSRILRRKRSAALSHRVDVWRPGLRVRRGDLIMRGSAALTFTAGCLIAAVWLSADGQSVSPAPRASAVTFSEHIAPILYGNCVTCHRPGEAAPFPLISYEDVAKRGTLLAEV